MSSVGGSDNSSRNDEIVRRNREDYQSKEGELVKKHKQEVRRLSERHMQELERLKQDHSNQMQEFKRSANETISARDHKYKKDMDNLRNIHRKQLLDVTTSNQKTIESARAENERSIEDMKLRHENRTHAMLRDYSNNMRKKDETYQQNLDEIREAQMKAVKDYQRNLSDHHAKEMDLLAKDRQREITGLQREYEDYRSFAENRADDHQMQMFRERERNSDNLMDTVTNERRNQEMTQQMMREDFQRALGNNREKYERTLAKHRDALENSRENLKSDVHSRVNDHVRRLERENRELKQDRSRLNVQKGREADQRVADAKREFQKNVEDYKMQRDETIEAFNERNAKDIEKLQKENSRDMVALNRRFRSQMQLTNSKYDTHIENLNSENRLRQDQIQQNADIRVNTVLKETEREKLRMQELMAANRNELQEHYQTEVTERNLKNEKEKITAIERMRQQIRKQELEHAQKLAQVVEGYESRITQMNDEIMKLRRGRDEDLKRITAELKRAHQLELDTQAVQNQDKLRQAQQTHSEEMRRVNQRHQERTEQLMTTLKAKV